MSITHRTHMSRNIDILNAKDADIFWRCESPGEIVQCHVTQLAGAAEGEPGPGRGLTLITDRADRSWEIRDDETCIASGQGEHPTAQDAVALRHTWRDDAWQSHLERTEASYMWSRPRPPGWQPGQPSPWRATT